MLNGLKKIVLGKKRLMCVILISVVGGVAVFRFVNGLFVPVEMRKNGKVLFAVSRNENSNALKEDSVLKEYKLLEEYKQRIGNKYLFLMEGSSYRRSGRYWRAVRAYRNIAKKYPEMAPIAFYEIANIYELSGCRDSKKIKAYQEIIQKFPDSQEAGKALDGLRRCQSFKGKKSFYGETINRYPDNKISARALEELAKLSDDQTSLYQDLIQKYPDKYIAEVAALSLVDMNFQKGNYRESLRLRLILEKKKEITAEKTQPEVRKAAASERADIYRQIEGLVRAGSSSPGYIKELANLFFLSGKACDALASYNDRGFLDVFFADEAKSLLRDQGDLKKKPGVSGFTAEERSLRRKILRITDEKVIAAYQKLVPTIRNDKAKNDIVRYLSEYILVTRSAFQVFADIDIFLNEIPMESLLPVLLGLVVETKGYQYGLKICQEIINRSPKSADAAIVLENVGDLYRQMNMNADAIKVYKKIVLGYPEYPGAIKVQEKIIDIYATDWQVYSNAGDECFELARIFPKSTEAIHAQFMVGKFYYLAGNYDQAIATLQNFVSKYPKTEWAPEAYLLMALNYLGKQENNIAVEQLRTLIRKYSKHELASRAQFLIGYCFLSQQKYDDALREYQKLGTDYPGNPYQVKAEEFIRRLSKIN